MTHAPMGHRLGIARLHAEQARGRAPSTDTSAAAGVRSQGRAVKWYDPLVLLVVSIVFGFGLGELIARATLMIGIP